MLSAIDKASFSRNGFLVVRDALDPGFVAELRAATAEAFDSGERGLGDSERILVDIVSRYDWALELMTSNGLLDPLRSLLGEDFAFLPEMSAHDSMYGSWHKDTGSQETAGHFFHLDSDYLMVEAAVYLQDNGPYGGGLDVIPGSHRVRARMPVIPIAWSRLCDRILSAAVRKVSRKDRYVSAVSVPSRAGDLVLFDFRIDHRATPPSICSPADVPATHRKLAIFFACSRNNEHAKSYKRFIATRKDYAYMKDHSYPESVLSRAREHSLTLA